MVSQYSGLNFSEAMELDCYTFKVLVRDSFISWMNGSKEGQEYLEKCWTLTQTNPDRESLRNRYSKGGK